jgi:ubiquinone/menaquinone biosynthesis C-methylase UbiE
MPMFLRGFLIVIGAGLFFQFVGIKIVYRLKARIGQPSPCPMGWAWTLAISGRLKHIPTILERAGLAAGQRVLDLGCGPGIFTAEAARQVGPAGQVIAIDLQPGMLALAGQRMRQDKYSDVNLWQADARQLPLPAESIDRALLVTVLPEIPNPQLTLAELYRVIDPAGKLSITEEFFDPDYLFPGETIRLVQSAGFHLEQLYGSAWRYTANFTKNGLPSRVEA